VTTYVVASEARGISLAEPGAIYVFHVGFVSQDGPVLQAIIDGLCAQGFAIVLLGTLLP